MLFAGGPSFRLSSNQTMRAKPLPTLDTDRLMLRAPSEVKLPVLNSSTGVELARTRRRFWSSISRIVALVRSDVTRELAAVSTMHAATATLNQRGA